MCFVKGGGGTLLKSMAYMKALIWIWMLLPVPINSSCIPTGETYDGYNPVHCIAFENHDHPPIIASEYHPCCAINTRQVPPIPAYLQPFLSYKQSNESFVTYMFFNYTKFLATPEVESILIPLGIPAIEPVENLYALNESKAADSEMFRFYVMWKRCDEMDWTRTNEGDGVPLVTISYGRYGEFIPQPLEFDPQCDLCKNTLFVKPDAASELFPGCRVEEGWPERGQLLANVFTNRENYTTAVFENGMEKQPYGFTPRGIMCPLKLNRWPDFHIPVHGTKTYAYLPLRIHQPDKIHFWDKDQISDDEPAKKHAGSPLVWPFHDHQVDFVFPPEYKLLVNRPTRNTRIFVPELTNYVPEIKQTKESTMNEATMESTINMNESTMESTVSE